MSVKLMTLVWEANLPKEEKSILLCYADFARDDGAGIFPSVGYVAWKTGYHPRSVQRITRKLKEKKILISDGQGLFTGQGSPTNKWRLDATMLPQRPPYDPDDPEKGDTMPPFNRERVTRCHPSMGKGDTLSEKGDTMPPDPLVDPLDLDDDGGGLAAASPSPNPTLNQRQVFAFYCLLYLGVHPDVAQAEAADRDPELIQAWAAVLHTGALDGRADNLPGLLLSKIRASPPAWPTVYPESLENFLGQVKQAIPEMVLSNSR